ncbi:MAG: DUF1501 domain-containing protein [Planctomycetaceae bacterium]
MTLRNHSPQNSNDVGCTEFQRFCKFSRRNVLQLGSLTGLALSMPQLLQAQADFKTSPQKNFGRAKRVIMLYLHGGHPQQETFDPKPNGPSAVRGEFSDIATSVTGVRFSELLPKIACQMHRLAVVRSMSHKNPNHVQASLPANTGHKHPPNVKKTDFPPSANDFPPFGAVLDFLHPGNGKLPNWVRVGPLMRRSNGTVLHGQVPGFLGAKHAPFAVDQKLTPKDVRIQALQPADDLTSLRLSARKNLLAQFDSHRRLVDQSDSVHNLNRFYDRAFHLLNSEATRRAFNLSDEPAALRARYGGTEFGQRCLLARRLAESGVRMVNVSYCHTPRGSWDTHSRNFTKMKTSLGPTLDTAFSALLEDLAERGMLEETLVILNAEFGRTPKINRNAGRDHWPWVYSLVLAGAGVQAGIVHGASDKSAAYPVEHPHDPADMAATIYHLLGVSENTTIYDAVNRPHRLIIGKPIQPILS